MVTKHGSTFTLDNVDRGILYQLQLNARKATHEEISDAVGVSPSTVRNRIAQLEQANIIETYTPELNYEQAGYPLRVQFICTAPPEDRSQCAQDALDINGVLTIHETITSDRNLSIEVVAADPKDLAEITQKLGELNLQIHSSDIILKTYTQPCKHFEAAGAQAGSQPQETPTEDG